MSLPSARWERWKRPHAKGADQVQVLDMVDLILQDHWRHSAVVFCQMESLLVRPGHSCQTRMSSTCLVCPPEAVHVVLGRLVPLYCSVCAGVWTQTCYLCRGVLPALLLARLLIRLRLVLVAPHALVHHLHPPLAQPHAQIWTCRASTPMPHQHAMHL